MNHPWVLEARDSVFHPWRAVLPFMRLNDAIEYGNRVVRHTSLYRVRAA